MSHLLEEYRSRTDFFNLDAPTPLSKQRILDIMSESEIDLPSNIKYIFSSIANTTPKFRSNIFEIIIDIIIAGSIPSLVDNLISIIYDFIVNNIRDMRKSQIVDLMKGLEICDKTRSLFTGICNPSSQLKFDVYNMLIEIIKEGSKKHLLSNLNAIIEKGRQEHNSRLTANIKRGNSIKKEKPYVLPKYFVKNNYSSYSCDYEFIYKIETYDIIKNELFGRSLMDRWND